MKILITGSSGNLGHFLAENFVSKKIQVVGIDIRRRTDEIISDYFVFYECSTTDSVNLEKIFFTENPTHIIHFACTFNKIRNKKTEYALDVEGSHNVINASNITLSVKQIIYSSSAIVYGGCRDNLEWIKESQPLRPGRYSYAINKKINEEKYLSIKLRENLRVIVLRMCTVIGPHVIKGRFSLMLLTRFSFLPRFCKFYKLQLLHEEDFLEILGKIIYDDRIKGVYNLSPDSYSCVSDLDHKKKYYLLPPVLIKAIIWILWNLRIINIQPNSVDNIIFPVILDPSKLKSQYKYKFKYSTAEAFIDTIRKMDQSCI